MSEKNADRHAWVDFAKGLCIVAVVTLYTTNYVNAELGRANWMEYWTQFAAPFRMPDFFLLSGLFLSRVIDRPWKSYIDKKVVHYLYFLVLWTLIIVPWNWLNVTWDVNLRTGAQAIIYHLYDPWAMLWFIQILAVYFMVTRLTRKVPWYLMFIGAALLQMFPYETPIKPVNWFAERYVYFYAGYIFANRFFSLAQWAADTRAKAVAGLVAWAIANGVVVFSGWSDVTGALLVLGFAGASAVMTLAALLQGKRSMEWLRWLGQNSIVVYLGFYLPMRGLIAASGALGLGIDPGWLSVIVGILSIASAVVLYLVTRNTWLCFLFERPKWAQLPQRQSVRLENDQLAATSGDRL